MLKAMSLAIALLAAAAFSMPSRGGEPSCNSGPTCSSEASGGACQACNACGGCENRCCPQCGCHEGLIPVCHEYWTKKKVTTFCYKCICEEICLPGPCGAVNDGFLAHLGCGCKEGCGEGCHASCNSNEGCSPKEGCGCENGCGDCCHCKYREVHHLVKCPVTSEVCVRKCKIEWVCPHCHCGCGCSGEQEAPATGAPTTAPTPPSPPMPPSNPPSPPTPGKTTATDMYGASGRG